MDKEKKKRIIFALGMGFIAAVIIFLYFSAKEKEMFGGSFIEVVSAKEEIPRGGVLTEENIAIKKIPKGFIHPASIPSSQAKRIIGCDVRYNIQKGQPLLWLDLGKGEAGISAMLNKGERALTLSVDEVSGLSGVLKPNDRVDIIGIFDYNGKPIAKVLMQNVTIIMAGTSVKNSEKEKESDLDFAKSLIGSSYSSITVAASPEEAEILTFAQERGRLVFVLRNSGDNEVNENIASVTLDSMLNMEKNLTAKRREKQGVKTEIIKGGIAE